ncbi:hypothetical protein IGI01_20835 [Bacillus thuringiensis]|nr:hypothetical protein [Bacillus thuringiensis]
MRAQNTLYPDNKLPERFDKANNMIIDVLSTWQPIFNEIDKEFPDTKRKAEKKIERNSGDAIVGEFHIHRLNPKKESEQENNNDY